MIIGETITLTELVTGADPFTITSRSVAIYDSGGVSVASGTPSLSGAGTTAQTLAFAFTAPGVGTYEAVFTVGVGSETRLLRQTVLVEDAPAAGGWPLLSDVDAALAALGITLRSGVTDAHRQGTLDGVIALFLRETGRQFIADTADTTRWYDGSGQTQLDVEDMISLSSVSVVPYPSGAGYQLAHCSLVFVQGETRSRLSLGTGFAPNYDYDAALGLGQMQCSVFPAGRQNIAVTGKFGVAPEVPADVRLEIRDEVVSRLGSEALFNPGYNAQGDFHAGRLKQGKDATMEATYEFVSLDDGTRVTARFAACLDRWRKRKGQSPRQLRPVMS